MQGSIINEELERALEIYSYLFEHKSLTREKERDLFDSYNEEEVQKLVKFIGKKNKVNIELINSTLYLVPDSDNRMLVYNKTELKKEIFKAGNYDEKDFNLANFIIVELLTTFYNSTSDQLAMTQISYNEFENRVNTSIKRASEYNLEELENEHNIAFVNIITKWNTLKGNEGTEKLKNTRYGFMSKVLRFLDNEKLINWYENDQLIVPRTKLTDLVCGIILYKTEFKKKEELFEKLKKERLTEVGGTI